MKRSLWKLASSDLRLNNMMSSAAASEQRIVVDYYRQFSQYTNPGAYLNKLRDELPNDVKEMGQLLRKQLIHRVTLQNGNTGSNTDLRYGDMDKVPWWRQSEDDIFPTAAGMLAELYNRDPRGFVEDRSESNKMILTCRFVSILAASILKSKGIPARVRSGFDPNTSPVLDKSCDHWVTQYWDDTQERWKTIDVDCCFEHTQYDPFDLPDYAFDWSADVWLNVRDGRKDGNNFWNAGGFTGLMQISWELFYDFHCLMNNEIIYLHSPEMVSIERFDKLTKEELAAIDQLAILMQDVDGNFKRLQHVWETERRFRLLGGALL